MAGLLDEQALTREPLPVRYDCTLLKKTNSLDPDMV
jgi:hypothetical protein